MIESIDVIIYLKTILDKKIKDLLVIDLRQLDAVADFFILCHRESNRQVKATAEHIRTNLKYHGIKATNIEGLDNSRWVILDYSEVVIHIFQEEFRYLYNLEGLWSNAVKFKIEKISDFYTATKNIE